MEKFAQMKSAEKRPYFEVAAAKLGLSQDIIEKDFWVCWTLNQLFSATSCKNDLLFKGGTSLSKVYRIIERFSEDIDISINKSYFGYENENDPERAPSKKKQQLVLSNINSDCKKFVQDRLFSELNSEFVNALSGLDEHWKVEIDLDDNDGQTILFHYPRASLSQFNNYVSQIVKIEMGARSDHWPSNESYIIPFIEETSPGALENPVVKLKALSLERTFWEKATILHKYSHFPDDKNVPERQSRHYYDFYKLLCSNISESASSNLELLARVREHKELYFKAAWANYSTAVKGKLRLIPQKRVLSAMENDYHKMSEMFFGEIVEWHEIIEKLKEFQTIFNA